MLYAESQAAPIPNANWRTSVHAAQSWRRCLACSHLRDRPALSTRRWDSHQHSHRARLLQVRRCHLRNDQRHSRTRMPAPVSKRAGRRGRWPTRTGLRSVPRSTVGSSYRSAGSTCRLGIVPDLGTLARHRSGCFLCPRCCTRLAGRSRVRVRRKGALGHTWCATVSCPGIKSGASPRAFRPRGR